eukprot:m.132631 g.132631  ORF g.132631 m.132631 type:complete len:814 (+) comp9490_c0_seq1:35-2476(+)
MLDLEVAVAVVLLLVTLLFVLKRMQQQPPPAPAAAAVADADSVRLRRLAALDPGAAARPATKRSEDPDSVRDGAASTEAPPAAPAPRTAAADAALRRVASSTTTGKTVPEAAPETAVIPAAPATPAAKAANAVTSAATSPSPSQEKRATIRLVPAKGNTLHLPESHGLQSLAELSAWAPVDEINRATTPLRPRVGAPPRLLVCHDMMGGYKQDRYPQGDTDRNVFRVYDWPRIDIFVYFSHQFVTIPPPVWTNPAHANGTRVLGTLITEWDQGAQLCLHAFRSQASAIELASRLVQIAEYYGFDGWLINIENQVPPEHVQNIVAFLAALKRLTAQCNPHGLVLWYDSVLQNGQLAWQNRLNAGNKLFFDACDGIFLNYNWNPTLLQESARIAGDRRTSVFAGIDVFGRGTYGGGGFSCDVAVRAIQGANVSTAVFAPGWVFEHFDGKNLAANSARFWSQFSSYPVHKIGALPFSTSFSRGLGARAAVFGRVVKDGPWALGSAQDVLRFDLPSALAFPGTAMAAGLNQLALEEDETVAYNGAHSVRLHGPTSGAEARCFLRLFTANVALPGPVCVTYAVAQQGPVQAALVLVLAPRGNDPIYAVLHGASSAPLAASEDDRLFRRYGVQRSDVIERRGDYIYLAQCPDDGWPDRTDPILDGIQRGPRTVWETRRYVLLDPVLKDRILTEIRFELQTEKTGVACPPLPDTRVSPAWMSGSAMSGLPTLAPSRLHPPPWPHRRWAASARRPWRGPRRASAWPGRPRPAQRTTTSSSSRRAASRAGHMRPSTTSPTPLAGLTPFTSFNQFHYWAPLLL